MNKKLTWQAYSSEERNQAIDKIKEVISRSSGYIINFNMFSDLVISLSIEIEETNIHGLHQALSQLMTMPELEDKAINIISHKEWLIFLNISFSSGKGNLMREIPSIPG